MDRLLSMAVFKRAVEAGSFAAAARQFGISPEMAGNHVRGLETHLGVRLLNRSTRRLNLTEAGGIYYERCTRILSDIQNAEDEVGALQASPRGLLRLAAPVTFGVLHLAPAVSAYMARYPDVQIDIAASDRYVNLIEEGFDLAIRIGDLPDSNLIARRLASARLVVCASPDYLAQAGYPQAPADLSRHACLIYAEANAADTWRFQAQDGRIETVNVSGPLRCTNPVFVHRVALAGHGVILGPSYELGADIARGRLVQVLRGWRSSELSIHALYPHKSLLTAKVRTFVEFLAERFAPEPEWEKYLTADASLR